MTLASLQRALICSLTLGAVACGTSNSPDVLPADSAADRNMTADAEQPDGTSGDDVVTLMDATADTGSRADASADAAPAGLCPTELPSNGTRCPREFLTCEYGDDPRSSCRPSANCSMGAWTVQVPRCPPVTPPAMCPATREAASGQSCTMMGSVCAYQGLTCTCTNCRSFPVGGCSGPVQWRCEAPSAQPNCPPAQPNLGSACAVNGTRCGYDCEATGTNGGRVCTDNIWVGAANNCPVSTRRAKRDIRYLDDTESAQLAHDTLHTRLATYEYTDPALRGRRRLGFVYEDSTTHPYARDPDISGVDMYGYTSMLLATVQQQQRQIDALAAQVRALRTQRTSR
ncbi:MAG: hypothetical protein Q8Q09_07935 [Deltaproteobacteria bacterium]|nr:hypothetical protein [Deltaproteobacteria bacterium]